MQSPRFRSFEGLLTTLTSQTDRAVLTQAWEALESLEIELGQAWDEHQAERADLKAPMSQDLERMEEGFLAWFEAFDLARVGEPEEALAAAVRGDVAFREVAASGLEDTPLS